MSMFQKLQQGKQMMQAVNKMRKLQNELSQQRVIVEKNGVRVVVSCDQKIQSVEIDGEKNQDIVNAANEALQEAQKEAAKKLQEMGGLDDLAGMLGR